MIKKYIFFFLKKKSYLDLNLIKKKMMLSLTHFHTFRPTGFFSTSHTNYLIHLISVERERKNKNKGKRVA